MGRVGSYPTFSPLPEDIEDAIRRYISVALVLGSPPAGVTRYPCPVEPGLSSPEPFQASAATVQPGRGNIVLYQMGIVKYLANSIVNRYTISKKQNIFYR